MSEKHIVQYVSELEKENEKLKKKLELTEKKVELCEMLLEKVNFAQYWKKSLKLIEEQIKELEK